MFNSNNSTMTLLKKQGSKLQLYVFWSTSGGINSKLCEVTEDYPPLSLISGKCTVQFVSFRFSPLLSFLQRRAPARPMSMSRAHRPGGEAAHPLGGEAATAMAVSSSTSDPAPESSSTDSPPPRPDVKDEEEESISTGREGAPPAVPSPDAKKNRAPSVVGHEGAPLVPSLVRPHLSPRGRPRLGANSLLTPGWSTRPHPPTLPLASRARSTRCTIRRCIFLFSILLTRGTQMS
jgi:hypothetical protein